MIKSKSILKEHVIKIGECKSREELYLILLQVRSILTNNRSFSFFLSKNKIVESKVKEIYLYNNSVKESVYRLINKIDNDILCKCGKNCRFLDNNRGYNSFCGDDKCIYVNEKRKISIKETFDRNYGGHPMKSEKTKNKLKKSIFDKYGHDNIMKYYSENNMIVSPFGLSSVKEKIKETFEKKYGGHPMQSDKSFEKNLKSRVKFKEYLLPSGKTIKLQGYELFGIEYLLNKYQECDIIQGVKEINKQIGFIYYTQNGKKRKYYSDFYIKTENKIYEVKSIWTYKANITKNILKKKACEEKGMKFEFLIFDYKGNIITDY
jgi:hypothetical protein